MAVDGGAMYSAAGYDIISDCRFRENVAGMNLNEVPNNSKDKKVPAEYSPL